MAEEVMAKLMSTSPENPFKHRFEEYARQIDQTVCIFFSCLLVRYRHLNKFLSKIGNASVIDN